MSDGLYSTVRWQIVTKTGRFKGLSKTHILRTSGEVEDLSGVPTQCGTFTPVIEHHRVRGERVIYEQDPVWSRATTCDRCVSAISADPTKPPYQILAPYMAAQKAKSMSSKAEEMWNEEAAEGASEAAHASTGAVQAEAPDVIEVESVGEGEGGGGRANVQHEGHAIGSADAGSSNSESSGEGQGEGQEAGDGDGQGESGEGEGEGDEGQGQSQGDGEGEGEGEGQGEGEGEGEPDPYRTLITADGGCGVVDVSGGRKTWNTLVGGEGNFIEVNQHLALYMNPLALAGSARANIVASMLCDTPVFGNVLLLNPADIEGEVAKEI